MAINERLVHTASAAAGGGTGNQEEGLILHLDANDVDSYDGDGTEWVDIANHEYTPSTDVSEHFNTVIYNGNGSSSGQAITGVGFKPDLVWVKKRNATGRHQIQHSLEDGWGDSSDAIPYAPSQAHIDFRPVSTFDSDGFTIPTNYTYNNHVSGTYVAWCFKAGGAPSGSDKVSIDGTSYATMSAAGLTDGTIAVDKLSVNRDLGFSAIQLDNKVTHPDKTIAHGLGVSPEMIIWKRTDSTGHWYVYHKGIGEAKHVILNSQAAAVSTPDWVESTPNSTTFDVSWSSGGRDYVAYCFASKRGVSKVGSYTGTGASNKVVTGFEPAFIIGKCTSNSPSNWWIFDNKREDEVLYPNLINDEHLLSDYVSFDRDGFTLSNAAFVNQSGRDYIYYAVAKNTNETSLIPDTDLELHLDAASFDGSTNTPSTWTDSSSNSNNGTISGATFDSELGNWLNFDGSNDYVQLPLNLHNTAFSVEFWAKGTLDSNNAYIIANNSGSSQAGWHIGGANGGGTKYNFRINNGSSNYLLLDSGTVDDTVWHHVVVTWGNTTNANGAKIYINGSLSSQGTSTSTTSFSFTNSDTKLMREPLGNAYSDGSIGQVRMYDVALTQAQIRQNFNFTKPNYPNGNDGTLVGLTSSDWNPDGYFTFNGTSDYLTTSLKLDTSNAFSFAVWFRPNAADNSDYQILIGNNSGSNPFGGVAIALLGSSDVISPVNGGTSTGFTTYTNGIWNHAVYTHDGQGNLKLYLNDSEVSSFNTSLPLYTANQTIKIGDTDIGTWNHFTGDISDVKVYDRELSSEEVTAQFAIKQFDIG
jgi:hypothetical protein